ncbi:LrgB family protein [Paenibacillus whitsoniae]|uniref:LrgB family protein n=1 Tax=Paenibacillus whitsoniae TaxID=2496558 RepID=A0A430JI79_9BACL|nr:LrgB family protein [Paenibacillus whitsoniae]RTE10702.1 LrgB family protein [Paenibacillus whitsoniae]
MIKAFMWLGFTIVMYGMSKRVYKLYPKIWLSPLLVTPAVVIAAVEFSGASITTYNKGTSVLGQMIEPATIALAVTLYRHGEVMKKHAWPIIASALCGGAAAIVTSAGLARLFGLSPEVMDSLAPRSATTPVALVISRSIGGVPTITAAATLVTGLLGLIAGPLIVKWLRIRGPIGRGVLYGTGAHSAGISKAMEDGAVTGSVAGIAMLVTALVTLCLAPWLVALF